MRKEIFICSLLMLIVAFSCNTKDTAKVSENKETMKTEKTELEIQTEETMNVAMKFMESMGKGDMETMQNLMHEDMVWHNEGDRSLPWIGPWSGKKVILEQFLPAFGANLQTTKWESTDGFAHGDTAAFFGKMKGLLINSGEETNEFTYALKVKVKDGKVILWNWFEDSFEISRAYHKK